MELNIQNVKDIVRLIQKVNCQNYALISEIAKEMGVKKTQMMMYIEAHPKLFKLTEAKKGLAVKTVYTDANQNPDTEEWMNVMKTRWNKKLHVGERTYYGAHEFWFFPEESEGTKESQYRNTREKFQELEDAGILKKGTRCYGGLSDSYKAEVYLYNTEVVKKLEEAGWSTDFQEVFESRKNEIN